MAWAFRGGDFLHGDEIGNLSGRAGVPYSRLLNFFPEKIYNDRPLGFFTARVLSAQVPCFHARAASLALHPADAVTRRKSR